MNQEPGFSSSGTDRIWFAASFLGTLLPLGLLVLTSMLSPLHSDDRVSARN